MSVAAYSDIWLIVMVFKLSFTLKLYAFYVLCHRLGQLGIIVIIVIIINII